MIQLNLLPDLKKDFLKAQRTKALVISGSILITIASLGITILIVLYGLFGQQIQLILVNNDIHDRTATLNKVPDLDKYLTIQNQLSALPALEGGKGKVSRLFQILPTLNPSAPNSVKLATLHLSTDPSSYEVDLNGTTSSFQALNTFVDTLNNAQVTYQAANSSSTTTGKIFTTVNVQNSGLGLVNGIQVISFSINMNYNPVVLDANNTNVNFTVPNMNTTPSVIGSPSGVFGQEGGK